MKVQFLKDTSTARIDDPPANTMVIYRDGFGYSLPKISGAEYMEFLEFKNKYTLFQPELIILVGLNRIITPSDRCDMVNEYLQTMTPNIRKICIDNEPFIGEPWRLWFHYSIANCGNFGITYSYAIETEWEHWFYRDIPDCRLSKDNIRLFIADTVSDLDPLVTEFEFTDIDESDESWYAEAKEAVFTRRNTPKLIINDLLKLANDRYGLNISFDSYRKRPADDLLFPEPPKIIMPDIGIYRFMTEENLRRMGIYNEVVKYENISN